MNQIIDSLSIFVLSFLCFHAVYKLMNSSSKEEDNKKKLDEKINMIMRQQDILLESTIDRDSMFSNYEQELDISANKQSETVKKIKLIMKRAGIVMPVGNFVFICFIGGCAFAALIVHFKFLNLLTGIPIGVCVGVFLVYNFLASQAASKKMQFLKQFPDAIDMMIRGVKAGLNVNRIMKLVSMESKDPIASEFRTISQKFDLGVEPEKVLVEAADKIDIEEFRFLVVALVLQMENGGVLAEILQNLSGIVRKRLELGLKLKAMSAEAKMSAIVISVLPFVFAGIMAIVNPSHLKEFTIPGTGQTLFKVAITLFSIGTFAMLKATKIKV